MDDFKAAVLSAFQNYANFEGRANRPAYWWFFLFYFVVYLIASLLHLQILTGLVGLALLLPSLAVGARRLHDIDRSGWWQLLNIVPFGFIVVLYWMCQPGTPGPNQYDEVSA